MSIKRLSPLRILGQDACDKTTAHFRHPAYNRAILPRRALDTLDTIAAATIDYANNYCNVVPGVTFIALQSGPRWRQRANSSSFLIAETGVAKPVTVKASATVKISL